MSKIDEHTQNKIIIKNSSWSVIFNAFSLIIGFFTAPLLINSLGDAKYGIYTTALSIVSWIYYFDFGIGSGLRNKVVRYIVKEDYDTVQKSVNIAYLLVFMISAIAFITVFIASLFFDFDALLNAHLTDENLNIIIVVAVLIACINFVISLSRYLLFAVQKIALVNGFNIVSRFFWLITLYIYSKTQSKLLIIVVLLEGISELLKNVIASAYISNKYSSIKPTFHDFNFSYARGILGFGLQIFAMQISALILNTTDNILIMKFFTAAEVTPYSLGHKYFAIIEGFFIAALGSVGVVYTTAYTLKDVIYIKKTLKRVLMLYFITLIGTLLAYTIYPVFMRIYLGRELEYQRGLLTLILLYRLILMFSHIFSGFVHGIGKVKLTTMACVLSAIVNIPCSIFFAITCKMRINGIILGSIVSLAIATPCYMYVTMKEIRKLGKN